MRSFFLSAQNQSKPSNDFRWISRVPLRKDNGYKRHIK